MPFKCDQCDKEFNTEQGLQQHKNDKHGVSRHEKKELKKDREEERKQEINKKVKSRKMKRWVIVAVIIIALLAGGYYLFTSLPKSSGVVVGPPGSTHIHHDMKVYVNGQSIIFSQPKYQLKSRLVHFEGGDGNVLHTHATGMTLAYALNTMSIQLAADCITVDGTKYCSEGNKTLKMYTNSEQITDPNYLMQDLDKILVSYGSEPVEPQLASITDLAKTQSGRVMSP